MLTRVAVGMTGALIVTGFVSAGPTQYSADPDAGGVSRASAAPQTREAASAHSLKLASDPRATASIALNGQTVRGGIYVYLDPVGTVASADFYVDTAISTGTPYRTERSAPLALAGDGATGLLPFDTTRLANGPHRVNVRVTMTSGATSSIGAAFTVSNPSIGQILFDADVARRGLSGYPAVIHPERISIVSDPVLGSARKVMKFTVYDSDTGPTGDPRAQVETAKSYGAGADIYVGWSTLFPADWPDALPAGGRSWITLEEVYGPPYAGAAPVKVGMRSGTPALTIQRNGSYNWDIPWEKGPIRKNVWYDFVLHEKLSQDPAVGFFELWVNDGSGWKVEALFGQPRTYMKTLDGANNGGANYSALKLYRLKGMYPVLTVYHAEHKVGTSFAAVAPRSHG